MRKMLFAGAIILAVAFLSVNANAVQHACQTQLMCPGGGYAFCQTWGYCENAICYGAYDFVHCECDGHGAEYYCSGYTLYF